MPMTEAPVTYTETKFRKTFTITRERKNYDRSYRIIETGRRIRWPKFWTTEAYEWKYYSGSGIAWYTVPSMHMVNPLGWRMSFFSRIARVVDAKSEEES